MQIVDIASKIIDTKDVDIYYDDSSIEFSSVLYLKKGFDKKRGLYFPKCDSLEVLEYYKNHYPINYFHIKGKITLVCNFNDISFSVFAMLYSSLLFSHIITLLSSNLCIISSACISELSIF